MRWPRFLRIVLLGFVLCIPAAALAQTSDTDLSVLPLGTSEEHRTALQSLTPSPLCPPAYSRTKRRTARPAPVLSAEALALRENVHRLGIDQHHFVHVELANGSVRTGAIVSINDSTFTLRDGIFHTQLIPYGDLKIPLRRVPAVGTHVGNVFKWTGAVAGITVGCVLLLPFAIVFIPLVAAGVIQD